MTGEIELRKSEISRVSMMQDLETPFVLFRLGQQRIETIEVDAAVQLFLLENKIHDFKGQPDGNENSIAVQGTMVDNIGSEYECSVEFYQKRNSTKSRIMKIMDISENFSSDDLVALIWSDRRNRLGLINVTHASELNVNDLFIGFIDGLTVKNSDNSQLDPSPDKEEDGGLRASLDTVQSSENSNPTSSIDDTIEMIWLRSFGGNLAATSPTSPILPSNLRGGWSPGLDVVSKLIKSRDPLEGPLVSVFLIGGPGAGKSTFAKHLLESLSSEVRFPDAENLRSWDLQLPGQSLLFVNDASIKNLRQHDSLSADISRSIDEGMDLLACANRGVIGDELNAAEAQEESRLLDMLSWLAQRNDRIDDTFESLVLEDYLQIARVSEESGRPRIYAAIYLDVCSIAQPQPIVFADENGWDSIRAEKQNMSLSVGQSSDSQAAPPIEELLTSILELLPLGEFQRHFGISAAHPVVANLQTLHNPKFRSGLLTSLRIAELNSGQLTTYRMFWGLVARLIFGSLVDSTKLSDLRSKLGRIELQIKNNESFSELSDLLSFRSPSSLYPNLSEGRSETTQDPILKLFDTIDPIKIWPVEFESSLASRINGVRAKGVLLDAFQSVESDKAVLEILREQEALAPILDTEFDSLVDTAYRKLISEGDDEDSWPRGMTLSYCQHLERMLGTYFGNCAGGPEAELLADLWESSPSIPADNEIASRFETLIKPRLVPQQGNSSPSLLPFLDSNLTPLLIQGNQSPRLAISLENVVFKTRREGPNLILELVELGTPLGHLKLDFSLMREVLASTGQTHGVTEETDYIQPRLDRVRGTKLSPAASDNIQRLHLVKGEDLRDLQVSGQ